MIIAWDRDANGNIVAEMGGAVVWLDGGPVGQKVAICSNASWSMMVMRW